MTARAIPRRVKRSRKRSRPRDGCGPSRQASRGGRPPASASIPPGRRGRPRRYLAGRRLNSSWRMASRSSHALSQMVGIASAAAVRSWARCRDGPGPAGDVMCDGQEPWPQRAADPSPQPCGPRQGRSPGTHPRPCADRRGSPGRPGRPSGHAAHQDREGQLGGRPVAAGEHLEELAIGLLCDRPPIEECFDVPEKGPLTILHPSFLPDGLSRHLVIMGPGGTIAPFFPRGDRSGDRARSPRVPARRQGESPGHEGGMRTEDRSSILADPAHRLTSPFVPHSMPRGTC